METKVLITLIILLGLAIITGIIFFLLMKKQPLKQTLFYILLALLVFATVGSIGLLEITRPRMIYFFLQIVFIGLGILHTWLMYKTLSWSNKRNFLSETLFTLFITLLGAAVFAGVFYALHEGGYTGPLASAVLAFLLPYFIHKTYCLGQGIPAPLFKTWQYSPHHAVPEADLDNAIRVHFRIAKNMYEGKYSKFTIRAPIGLSFGDLFYTFIKDYNQGHPEGPIEPQNTETPFSWMFYTKPGWWQSRNVIDPDLTVKSNNIEDNTLINAKRVSLQDLKP